MWKIFFIIIIIFFSFLLSCNQSESYVAKENILILDAKRVVDFELEQNIIRYINDVESLDSVREVVYTVSFISDSAYFVFGKKDSVVIISLYNCYNKLHEYRGVIKIRDFTVAIVDNNKIGDYFYNDSLLTYLPIDSLVCINQEVTAALTFVIKNRNLFEWNP